MKKIERIDQDLPAHIKNELFVARNYKIILIFALAVALLSVIFTFINVQVFMKTTRTQAEALKNISNKVLVVRMDGKVVQLDKEPLSQQTVEIVLKDLILNYSIISAFDFMYSEVTNLKDMMKMDKIKKLSYFFDEKAVNSFLAFLETLFMSYKANNLPEVIFVPSAEKIQSTFLYSGNKFEYRISIPVVVHYVYAQAWRQGFGNIQLYVKGFVDANKSSPENPLGIHITNIKVEQYVQKSS